MELSTHILSKSKIIYNSCDKCPCIFHKALVFLSTARYNDTQVSEGGDEMDSVTPLHNKMDRRNSSDFSIERQSVSSPSSMRAHHYHDRYELYYLCSGQRYYFIKDKTYHVQKGNFVLIPPYDIHSTSNVSNNGYDRFLISFSKDFLSGFAEAVADISLFDCFEKGIHLIQLNAQERYQAEALLLSMLQENTAKESGYQYYLKTAMLQLLLLIARHSNQPADSASLCTNAAHKTISQAAAYINTHYPEDITLESVSRQFFISPCYFSRTFKSATGISFCEYLNGVRIKEAQRLLQKSDENISEIAQRVGFKSSTHFGRVFKATVGISPVVYRKSLHR